MGNSDFPTGLGIVMASAILGALLAVGIIVGMFISSIASSSAE